jgi:hypothetical protein
MSRMQLLHSSEHANIFYIPVGECGFKICGNGVLSYHKVSKVSVKISKELGVEVCYHINTGRGGEWCEGINFFPTFEEAFNVDKKWGYRIIFNHNWVFEYSSERLGRTVNPLGWDTPLEEFTGKGYKPW